MSHLSWVAAAEELLVVIPALGGFLEGPDSSEVATRAAW